MDYNEFYNYNTLPGSGMEDAVGSSLFAQAYGVFSGIIVAFASILFIYYVIQWVFRSIGLYHMAKNRGIAHAWFAWVPFLSNYILGRLINNKVVLGDSIVTKHAEFFLPFLGYIAAAASNIPYIGIVLLAAIEIYQLSALWRLFKIYRPKNRVSYTIWSAFIGSGFFIFAVRDDKPFDPLEPNKVYQNLYQKKDEITSGYDTVVDVIRGQEKDELNQIDDSYEKKMSNPDLTNDEKVVIEAEHQQEIKDTEKQYSTIMQEERALEYDKLDDLEQEYIDHSAYGTPYPDEEKREEQDTSTIEAIILDSPIIEEDVIETDE